MCLDDLIPAKEWRRTQRNLKKKKKKKESDRGLAHRPIPTVDSRQDRVLTYYMLVLRKAIAAKKLHFTNILTAIVNNSLKTTTPCAMAMVYTW